MIDSRNLLLEKKSVDVGLKDLVKRHQSFIITRVRKVSINDSSMFYGP